MLGALYGTVSVLNSSSQLLAGARDLSRRINQLVLPASPVFTVEEREQLFAIQSYLVALMEPLRLAMQLSMRRHSAAKPILAHAGSIVAQTLVFVNPLLLGQRPLAAAHAVAQKPTPDPPLPLSTQNQRIGSSATKSSFEALSGLRTFGGTVAHTTDPMSLGSVRAAGNGASSGWAALPTQENIRTRAGLHAKLAHCASRLAVALQLLQTALTTCTLEQMPLPQRERHHFLGHLRDGGVTVATLALGSRRKKLSVKKVIRCGRRRSRIRSHSVMGLQSRTSRLAPYCSDVCLVTLLQAVQRIRSWGSCRGDLFSLQGLLLELREDDDPGQPLRWHIASRNAVIKLERIRCHQAEFIQTPATGENTSLPGKTSLTLMTRGRHPRCAWSELLAARAAAAHTGTDEEVGEAHHPVLTTWGTVRTFHSPHEWQADRLDPPDVATLPYRHAVGNNRLPILSGLAQTPASLSSSAGSIRSSGVQGHGVASHSIGWRSGFTDSQASRFEEREQAAPAVTRFGWPALSLVEALPLEYFVTMIKSAACPCVAATIGDKDDTHDGALSTSSQPPCSAEWETVLSGDHDNCARNPLVGTDFPQSGAPNGDGFELLTVDDGEDLLGGVCGAASQDFPATATHQAGCAICPNGLDNPLCASYYLSDRPQLRDISVTTATAEKSRPRTPGAALLGETAVRSRFRLAGLRFGAVNASGRTRQSPTDKVVGGTLHPPSGGESIWVRHLTDCLNWQAAVLYLPSEQLALLVSGVSGSHGSYLEPGLVGSVLPFSATARSQDTWSKVSEFAYCARIVADVEDRLAQGLIAEPAMTTATGDMASRIEAWLRSMSHDTLAALLRA